MIITVTSTKFRNKQLKILNDFDLMIQKLPKLDSDYIIMELRKLLMKFMKTLQIV